MYYLRREVILISRPAHIEQSNLLSAPYQTPKSAQSFYSSATYCSLTSKSDTRHTTSAIVRQSRHELALTKDVRETSVITISLNSRTTGEQLKRHIEEGIEVYRTYFTSMRTKGEYLPHGCPTVNFEGPWSRESTGRGTSGMKSVPSEDASRSNGICKSQFRH